MTKAEQALNFITTQIESGKTVTLASGIWAVKVSPKTYSAWKKSGNELFKIGNDGWLYIASGKKFNAICSPSLCMVQIVAG